MVSRRGVNLDEPRRRFARSLAKGPSNPPPLEPRMTGRAALPILVATLLAAAGIVPAAAQALGPDEAHVRLPRARPTFAPTAAQRSVIYGFVRRQHLHAPSADVPQAVSAPVPRSADLLPLPDEAIGDDDAWAFLKYAMVDGNVVLVDSIDMRVIDIIRRSTRP
jgi:hypothetical protein